MALVMTPVPVIPLTVNVALRQVSIMLTRDGQQTANPKLAMLMSPAGLTVGAVLVARNGVSVSQKFVASAIDGEWLLTVLDTAAPKRAASRYPAISQDVTFNIDLNDGSGSGGGSPADLVAVVKVDGLPADRQVVAVEQLPSGEWRVAGYDSTAGGEVAIDLRVAGGGQVYVMALDNWGTQYQPNLNVGVKALVRPTVFMGWLYRVTQAGQLPAIEPTWWDDSIQGPQPLGTARAEVVRYYAPQGRGPIPVEVT